ncbi:MAG: hypothetical protein DIKNOCCD_02129 [bacterium]|nr:hypothetical protein [bacterium]
MSFMKLISIAIYFHCLPKRQTWSVAPLKKMNCRIIEGIIMEPGIHGGDGCAGFPMVI